jgi:hypothetical protein
MAFRSQRTTVAALRWIGRAPAFLAAVALTASPSLRAQEAGLEQGRVVGHLVDGVGGGALAGAPVYLVGTEFATRSDSGGRFELGPLPAGRYLLRFQHPDPRFGRIESPSHLVEVMAGTVTTVEDEFAAAWAAAQLCGTANPEDAHQGDWTVLLGRVRDAASGETVPEALIWLREAGQASAPVAVQADSVGEYLVCDTGPGAVLVLQASGTGLLSDSVAVEIGDRPVVVQDLRVSPVGAGGGAVSGPGVALQGTVRSVEEGEPVVGARVRLLEAGVERLTGSDGTFFIPRVAHGHYRLVTEHLGMASDTVRVDLTTGTIQLVALTLETRPVALPTLAVEVERTLRNPHLSGFFTRMERGLGYFITRQDLESGDVVSSFRRLPNVQLSQCMIGTSQRKANCWELSLQRAPISLDIRRGDRCPPLIYLDGHLITLVTQPRPEEADNAFSRIQQLPPDVIEGIEVYRNPATAPGEFRRLGDTCGIVLVWTRRR